MLVVGARGRVGSGELPPRVLDRLRATCRDQDLEPFQHIVEMP